MQMGDSQIRRMELLLLLLVSCGVVIVIVVVIEGDSKGVVQHMHRNLINWVGRKLTKSN